MKKTLLGVIALASLGFVACDSSNAASKVTAANGDKEVLYSGIVPAADAQGTVCTLKLDYDDDHNYTDGDYLMVENTLASDSVAASGLREVATSYTEGDFRKESKQVNGATVEYIRLVPDAKDAMGDPSASSLYFIINADQSLTMVNSDLEVSATSALYTLTVK